MNVLYSIQCTLYNLYIHCRVQSINCFVICYIYFRVLGGKTLIGKCSRLQMQNVIIVIIYSVEIVSVHQTKVRSILWHPYKMSICLEIESHDSQLLLLQRSHRHAYSFFQQKKIMNE